VAAAPRPIVGAERVAAFLARAARFASFDTKPVWLNGSPGGQIDIDGERNTVMSVCVQNGRITHVYAIRNPDKLARLDEVAALTRS
jgi:hypothetical protein